MGNVKKLLVAVILYIFVTLSLWREKEAEATNFTRAISWPIKRTTPNIPEGAVSVAELLVYSCYSDCPSSQTGAWASDWAYVECSSKVRADGGYNYFMTFASPEEDWPSSWPTTVTCSKVIGSDVYSATATLDNAPSESGGDQYVTMDWSPSSGATMNFRDLGDDNELSGARIYEAPDDTYTTGEWTAIKSGTVWSGVKCGAIDRSSQSLWDVIYVKAGQNAVEGTGTCVIPRSGQGALTFSLVINRE